MWTSLSFMKVTTLLECNLGSLSMMRSFSPCSRHKGRIPFSKTASITFPSMLSCSKCRLLMILTFDHWGQGRKWISASNHDCQPAETEFADDYELAQQDLEMREENLKRKRPMAIWKNSLVHVWENHPIEATRKLIDRSNAQNHESNYRCRWGKTSY